LVDEEVVGRMDGDGDVIEMILAREVFVVVVPIIGSKRPDQGRTRRRDPTVELEEVIDNRSHDLSIEVRRVLSRDKRFLEPGPKVPDPITDLLVEQVGALVPTES
jgi:hypothetical protein